MFLTSNKWDLDEAVHQLRASAFEQMIEMYQQNNRLFFYFAHLSLCVFQVWIGFVLLTLVEAVPDCIIPLNDDGK